MHRTRYKLVAALCLVFLLAQAVSGCRPQTAAPTSTPVEKATVEPTPTAAEKDEVVSPTPDKRGQLFFAPDHVIFTGPGTRVKEVVAGLQGQGGPLPPVALEQISASLDLSYLDKLLDACQALSMFRDKPADDPVVMELYQIIPTGQLYLGDIPLAVLVAEQVNRDSQDSLVFADLTYLTGRPPFPLDGDPWTGEGSPWTGEGSDGADPAAAAQASFWTQWALGSRDRGGIELMASEGERSVQYAGNGIRVGVFDTTPYAGTNVETVDWVTPPLMLNVVAQPPVPSLEDLIRMPLPSEEPPIPDHGLFVAGLVHAVAPGSQIQLYQVLDDYGHGHSWALNEALYKFITQTLADRDKLDGAVINLSFGGNLPTDLQGREVLSFQDLQSHGLPGDVIARLPEDVLSLYVLLSSAYCSGIVVSAASGNDSADAVQAKPAQFPASAFQCLAVAASDSQRRRACFSNRGRVTAPGGTGTEPGCAPALDTCSDDCEYAVISLVSRPDDDSTGYAFWAGTSFATPLVSGLAALVLEAEGGWSSAEWSSPDGALAEHVSDRIANCAALSDGIINVPETLANGSCPEP